MINIKKITIFILMINIHGCATSYESLQKDITKINYGINTYNSLIITSDFSQVVTLIDKLFDFSQEETREENRFLKSELKNLVFDRSSMNLPIMKQSRVFGIDLKKIFGLPTYKLLYACKAVETCDVLFFSFWGGRNSPSYREKGKPVLLTGNYEVVINALGPRQVELSIIGGDNLVLNLGTACCGVHLLFYDKLLEVGADEYEVYRILMYIMDILEDNKINFRPFNKEFPDYEKFYRISKPSEVKVIKIRNKSDKT